MCNNSFYAGLFIGRLLGKARSNPALVKLLKTEYTKARMEVVSITFLMATECDHWYTMAVT